jgi:dihydroorotate dehydrogenase
MELKLNFIEFAARFDKIIRKQILKLHPTVPIFLYSYSRKLFLKAFETNLNFEQTTPPEHLRQTLWDIEFRSPIFNAAGMFKKGAGYETVYKQGAGAFLAGTTTSKPRSGNIKKGILHPFIPYAETESASNWMGLPNEGHSTVAKRLSRIEKQKGCPIGASIAADVGVNETEIIAGILEGFELYDRAGVDFIELNESCPNVAHHSTTQNIIDSDISSRLAIISEKFLKKRKRNLPVIVKFSNDIEIETIPSLIDLLIELGYDGINIGNTSTKYDYYRQFVSSDDIKNYDYFTATFDGGLSGKLLRANSFEKSKYAAEYISRKNLSKEFYVVRTGGVSSAIDIIQSQQSGVNLLQWFSAYFENFSKYGYSLYAELYRWL